MERHPQVSIIIAAYNVRQYIDRAIDSVVAQTRPDWELIVVDDASSDGTADHVVERTRGELRIKVIRLSRNSGPSAARNRGIDAATGDWVAVLDADDAWRPQRMERLLTVAADTGATFVADDLVTFDDGLKIETGVALGFAEDVTRLDLETFFAYETPLRLGLLKPFLQRTFLVESRLRYDERLRSAEDFMLYAELLFHGAVAVVAREPGYVYTARVGPRSRQRSAGSRSNTSLDSLFWIADTLTERYGAEFTPTIGAGLERFRGQTRRRWIASEITRLRRSRNFPELIRFLVRHPQGAARYVVGSQTWRRAFQKTAAE